MREIVEWIFCIIIALIIALLIRYYIGTPTIVKHKSMYPTLDENQRLILNRTFRISNKKPKVGDIITFEAPSKMYSKDNVDQSNPVAKYEKEPEGWFLRFGYYGLEVTKISYIKRVIALEGDHVKIENGKVYINGELKNEQYLSSDVVTKSDVFNDFIVPEGYFFAMGDNRENSVDCRDVGCIPFDKLEGIVVCRFWPLNKITKY